MEVIFYNRWHCGDVFLTLGFLRYLSEKAPFPIAYAHPYTQELKPHFIQNVDIENVPDQITNGHKYFLDKKNSRLYVNTWVGAYKNEVFPQKDHPDFNDIKSIWEKIFARLGVAPANEKNLHLYLTIGEIAWTKYRDCDFSRFHQQISKFSQTVWVCNSKPLSIQTDPGKLNFALNILAMKYPDVGFFCSERFPVSAPNIVFIDDFFPSSRGNIFAFSHLSTFFDLFAGLNTGPLTVVGNSKNLGNATARILYVGGSAKDIPIAGPNFSASIHHLSDNTIETIVDGFDVFLHSENSESTIGKVKLSTETIRPIRFLVVNGPMQNCGISEYGKSFLQAISKIHGISGEVIWADGVEPIFSKLSGNNFDVVIINHHPEALKWFNDACIPQIKSKGVKVLVITGHEHFHRFWSADAQLSADPCVSTFAISSINPPLVLSAQSQKTKRINNNYDLTIGHSGLINNNKSLVDIITFFSRKFPDKRFLFRFHISLGDYVTNSEQLLSSFLTQIDKMSEHVEVEVGFLKKAALINWYKKNDLVVYSYSQSGPIGASAAVNTSIEAGVPFLVNDSSFFDHVRRRANNLFNFEVDEFDALKSEFAGLRNEMHSDFLAKFKEVLNGVL